MTDQPTPYYQDDLITLYHADSLAHTDLWAYGDVLVTDPPYGMSFVSNASKYGSTDPIAGDDTPDARDRMLDIWLEDNPYRPALVFGTWRVPRPKCRNVLAWVKGNSPGMGDLACPWGHAWEEVYVIGKGFAGRRVPNHLTVPVQSASDKTRPDHPTPKPVALMERLIEKCPPEWVIVDPFAGSGATLRAAKNLGRRAIGVELEEKYCRITADRLAQEALFA